MRIVLVNWAKIWDGSPVGGGVNGYCQSLGLELVARGHEVFYVCGGTTFVPDSVGIPPVVAGACSARRHPDWFGIRCFEVINSPTVAPAHFQFRDPLGETTSRELESVFARLVETIAPDVVHFHNIEGFTAGTVEAVRQAAVPNPPAVLYTLHNYHTVCPQVYLMHRNFYPCHDYQGGTACLACMSTPDARAERDTRAAAFAQSLGIVPLVVSATAAPHLPPGEPAPHPVSPADPARRATWWNRSETHESSQPEPPPAAPEPEPIPVALPGSPVTATTDATRGLSPPIPDMRGQSPFVRDDLVPPRLHGPADPEWAPLTNDIRSDLRADTSPNPYAVRRRAMIAMLNACDRVLAVSRFVEAKYVSLGVNPAVIRTNHIGTRSGRVVERHRELRFDPPPLGTEPHRPIRLVFMGYNNYFKGLPMLAETLELLIPEYLARFELHIYAQAVDSIEWRFRRLEPRLARLVIGNGYQYFDVPWILGGKDLGLVTSVWWDNAPQTVFEYFASGVPVIGADVGGIPDFVRDGENGLLFRANDRYDLARRLVEVARRPALVEQLRRNVRPPKDIGDHAAELESIYASCLPSRPSRDNRSAVPDVIAAAPAREFERAGSE